MKLIFATNNPNKLAEVNRMLDGNHQLLSLEDAGIPKQDIPETGDTLEANALQKARFIHQLTGCDCFADDTGLEVDALNGDPGVYSARYAGEQKNDADNVEKLLHELDGESNRKAHFRTVIALIASEKEYLFEGVIEGKINTEVTGEKGFGYDPVFIPEGENRTFAEMEMHEKNEVSHRKRAIEKMAKFLKNIN